MDYRISPYPLRLADLKVDPGKLLMKSLQITNVGHLPGRTLQNHRKRFHQWALVYISGGEGYYQIGDEPRQHVRAGSFFWLYPGVEFSYGPFDGGYWDEHYFTLLGPRVEEWIRDWDIDRSLVHHAEVNESFFGKMEYIYRLMESGIPADADRAAIRLESFLYELATSSRAPRIEGRTQRTLAIIEDITSSLREPLDARKLAERHHISLQTLRRTVQEFTGYPLNEYVHRLKMAEAKNIMINSDLQIKEVAEALGYRDEFYFSRLFKKIVGVAPKHYRMEMLAGKHT
ncbi:AraC family transcriptional regulator [Paenibacillus thermoaerophilus]|nr:AraC family transcriptional regulator [Paenibacillus thermoaerophilus]